MERSEINNVYSDANTKKYYETFGVEIDYKSEYDYYFLSKFPESLIDNIAIDIGAGNGKYSELLINKGAKKSYCH